MSHVNAQAYELVNGSGAPRDECGVTRLVTASVLDIGIGPGAFGGLATE